MPTLTLKAPYKQSGLILSSQELDEMYLYGIKIQSMDGKEFPTSVRERFIKAAQEEVEKKLNIKFRIQKIMETRDFHSSDFMGWGAVRCSYPIRKICSLKGILGTQEQIVYPIEWLSMKRDNKGRYWRNLRIIPNGTGSNVSFGAFFPGYAFLSRRNHIPNFWEAQYMTGFDEIPSDLLTFVGMMAAVNMLYVADGAASPASSQSLGIDGLSQSVSSTKSGTTTIHQARINGYIQQLKDAWPNIQNYYKGFTATSL